MVDDNQQLPDRGGHLDGKEPGTAMTEVTTDVGDGVDLPEGWTIRRTTGPADSFHRLDPVPSSVSGSAPDGRPTDLGDGDDRSAGHDGAAFDHQIWIHSVPTTAVILGSTQRLAPGADAQPRLLDHRGQPVELCRRRSGGGLVVVVPGDAVWVDVIVPRWSRLHDDDVTSSFHWFGRCWRGALAALIAPQQAAAAMAPETATPAGDRPTRRRPFHCFAEIGHGEVVIGEHKVVGLSQRRSRHWSRLQSLMLRRWDGEAVNDLLQPLTDRRHRDQLGQPPFDARLVRAGLPEGMTLPPDQDIIDRLITTLPRGVGSASPR